MKILTVRGRSKAGSSGGFDWADAVVDAAIIGGLTFFSTLGGTAMVGLPSKESLVAAGIAAATQFFICLAVKRGLREK